MIKLPLFAATVILLAATLPAQAVTCFGPSDDSSVEISFGIRIGAPYTETERNDIDLMRLRQAGVDATRVERWNGCLRAFVLKPGGGEIMQFFEPGSLRQVE